MLFFKKLKSKHPALACLLRKLQKKELLVCNCHLQPIHIQPLDLELSVQRLYSQAG